MPNAQYIGKKKAVMTYVYGTSLNNTASPITHSGVNFGAAAADRYIYCMITGLRNVGVGFTSCTIGGVAATKLVSVAENTANLPVVTIWGALVPTGTSGTIQATMNQTTANALEVYAVTGLNNPLSPIFAGGANATTSQAQGFTCQAGDFVMSGVQTATTTGITWSNIWGSSAGHHQNTITGQSWRYGSLAAVFSSGGSFTSTTTGSGSVTQGLLVLR